MGKSLVSFILMAGLACFAMAEVRERTVIDNIGGGFFTSPGEGHSWDELGICIGLRPPRYNYAAMNSEAPKGIHARLQHFEVLPGTNYAYFPMDLLRSYEADEVRQGRDPILCTATYEGQKKPLIWGWHFKQWGNSQPVNLRDDRFIKFFVKQYVRAILDKDQLPNWHVGLDNFTFDYSGYGVVGADPNKLVRGVTWDKPFPQSSVEWMEAALYCCGKISEMAPDIKFIANEATFPDETYGIKAFRLLDGVIFEGYKSGWGGNETRMNRMTEAYADHIQVFQIKLRDTQNTQDIIEKYVGYLTFKGPNAYFNLLDSQSREIDPKFWAQIRNNFGEPVEDFHFEGDRWIRKVQGGTVWFEKSGKLGYKLDSNEPRAATPMINPRRPLQVTGPLTITLATEPFTSEAEIHYTLDGTEPTKDSPKYTEPLSLTKDTVVKAKAFKQGLLDSFTGFATYKITSEDPKVEFYLAADNGSEFFTDDYPLVALSHPSAKTVSVDYKITGGSAKEGEDYKPCQGTLTIEPGEQFKWFPVALINDTADEPDETIEITLSAPKNAALGEKATYTYTIVDND